MTAHTEQTSGMAAADTQPEAMFIDDDTNSSPAPHMTNPNYRIIMPTPGSSTSAGTSQARAPPSNSLPSWISAAQSKTYFPASSPILGGAATDDAATARVEDAMQVDSAHELRTEYDILPYEIFSWSNHSANFLPHNILTDRPHDQASRWSTNANNHRQFITLRLERPALVRSIKFGKFYKTHVCNLKEFKVFGGMTQDNMVELLYSGLRNDSEAETISIRQRLNGHYIPCQFIKIQPLLAYDQKFNFSIWHVELRGTIDAQIVQSIIDRFNQYKDEETIRSCLKFYRDRNYTSAFEALEKQTKLKLEAPILSNLREALVEKCNYTRVEQLLHEAERSSMFTSCAAKIPYAAKWELVESAVFTMPPGRGGHQMCVDEDSRIAYLYGGWDGKRNLDDLWMLNMDTGRWTCLSLSTHEQGGPGPRSCHAMCFDSERKCIYIMGKYVDFEYRGNTGLENDLYCYDTINSEWLVLSENTEAMSGPKLVYNSQMAFDPRGHRIYVYGGKVVLPDVSDSTTVYSGLYCFDLRRHCWTKLKPDFHMLEQEQHVRGRYFHSLLIDTELQRLYIISSKRDVSLPSDLIVYDIATDTFFEKMADLAVASAAKQPMTQERYLHEQQRLSPAFPAMPTRPPCPHPDFADHHALHTHMLQDGRTIRATLDTERQEIYVLTSVQNDTHSSTSGLLLQSLISARGSRSSGYYDQSGAGTPYTGSLYSQSLGTGFHPCSSMIDSGVRYEPERPNAAPTTFSANTSRSSPGSSQCRPQLQPDYILMAVFCYHIPTETWTEIHNSARTAALYGAAADSASAGDAYKTCALGASRSKPSFPAPRFAQDWAFDRLTRKHFMFGGNPNRPNDKYARFNDTWQLEFTRPDSHDILRRALYLVRQRWFLDMCSGAEPFVSCNKLLSEQALPGQRTHGEYSASAIPSPNNAILGSPTLSASSSKRSPSPDQEAVASNHQAPQKKLFVSDSAAAASSSQPKPTLALASADSLRDQTAHALAYLQTFVAPLVDSSDPHECQSFHSLSTALFNMANSLVDCSISPEELQKVRSGVYEALLLYFPQSQQQPPSHLENIITMLLD
ncbi:hypothetical protein LPJ62_002187 [Coemansia sp. RSA 2167]|nr:hypothetical protein LPJ62_002187 [Coemansia sp. RSA 2167]